MISFVKRRLSRLWGRPILFVFTLVGGMLALAGCRSMFAGRAVESAIPPEAPAARSFVVAEHPVSGENQAVVQSQEPAAKRGWVSTMALGLLGAKPGDEIYKELPDLPAARSSGVAEHPVSGENQAVVQSQEPVAKRGWVSILTFGLLGSKSGAASSQRPDVKSDAAQNALVQGNAEEVAPKADSAFAARHDNKTNSAIRLRAGLVVNVSVLVAGKKEIEETDKRIADSGTLNLPMLGIVPIQDETTDSLAKLLTARYQVFFVNPQVLVDIVHDDYRDGASPWGYITVLGRVKKPGRISIPATMDMTITRAIQQAGGFETSAKDTAIRLTRRKADGGTETRVVNLKAVGSSGMIENDLELLAGDVVFVPELVF